MIWICETMSMLRQTNSQVATRESSQCLWQCSVIHPSFSWMSPRPELIHKQNDSCGTSWPRSPLRKSKVASSSQLIQWRRQRHCAQKWASWSRASSSASDHQLISKTNLVQAMRLSLRSECLRKMRPSN